MEKVTNTETRKSIKADIKSLYDQRAKCTTALKRYKSLVLSSRKSRQRIKKKLMASEKLDKSLFPRSKPGRPRLTEAQDGQLQAIEEITTANFDKSCSDLRRRSSIIRTRISLNYLCCQLKKRNFNLKRTATYLRLIPKWRNTRQGKRHVETVPVKLVRAENNTKENHNNAYFFPLYMISTF